MTDRILDCLMAINLDVTIWTARRKLTPADFGGAELPPEELASLGSKRVCNPEELKVFGMLKARAVSLLDRHGVRFLGGWGIPADKAEGLVEELRKIQSEFAAAKTDFLSRYDQAVQEWISRHTGWEQLIADSTVSADYVRSRLGFTWQVYRIMPPGTNTPIDEGLKEEMRGLGNTLFDEVAKSASEAWHKSFAGKLEVTHKALSPLRTIQQKLAGLTFIEPRVAPIADLIQTAFASLPRRGMIRGGRLLMLQGLVALLRDPQALIEHGQKIIEGCTPAAILDGLLAGGCAQVSSCPNTVPQDVGQDMPVDIAEILDADDGPVFPEDLPDARPQPVLPNCGLW
ncbi:DUF3150 domain-containing protein [Desulfocurvibacter africanus]|uniref:DUF3150 domain-containing protein n=1 Tax=Desulfocurvibacter africanus TaxID=873 RepID=UPI0003FBA2E2|nr:DUF3150 domain-containing protein [Desulfocurvibacter africanus]